MTLGRPSGVVCRPAAPGSTPVSKIATTTFRPSYSGCAYIDKGTRLLHMLCLTSDLMVMTVKFSRMGA